MTMYLGNDRNVIRDAVLSALNIVPSAVVYRTDTAAKLGSGSVSLTGDYTGQADANYDVEIVDTAGTTRRISAPKFVGVGSGRISDIAATTDLAAQTITVTLEDAGTITEYAQAPFQGATLRAAAAGSSGNSISVSVSEAGLTATATNYALREPLRAGTNEYVGDHWNFGAVVLNPDGTIPSNAPRIRFGHDPQVYRAYRAFKGGRYVYSFSPAPVRDVAAGARVKTVTGTRTITITDGVTPETHTSITTLYDALTKIRDDSALVTVVGPIVNDRLPGGQAVVDLSVRTSSYVSTVEADGSSYVRNADIGITVASNAPTELLTIECKDSTSPGSETWGVRGQVSGEQADAVTGVAYSAAGYGFTIPTIAPPPVPSSNRTSAVLEPIDRSEEEEIPKLCYENLVIGAQARAKTYTFIWRRRPGDCECGDIDGGPIDRLLGIDSTTEGQVSTLHEDLQEPFEDLYGWYKTFSAGVTDIETSPSVFFQSNSGAIAAAQGVVSIFSAALRKVVAELNNVPAGTQTTWDSALTSAQTDLQAVDTIAEMATTSGVDAFLERYRAAMNDMLVEAGIDPNFEDAALQGNEVWRDYGENHWFESLDGLLALQPGHYYHSAKMGADATGRAVPVSTQEFGVGIAVGCDLKEGDKLYILIDTAGVVRATYQQGDRIEVQVTRAEALALFGGVTGDNTLTFSVIGSVAGRLADYELVTTSPAAYSDSGLSFEIEPGGIRYALGDRYTFDVEAGRFKWRKNGGSWSSATDIGSGTIEAGLTAVFTGGASPSWVAGDRWSFTAEAINGPDRLRQPTPGQLAWTSSTTVAITPADANADVAGLLIADHTIPSTATITLQGSDDNFSTTPFSQVVTWRERNIWLPFAKTDYAKWRLVVTTAGSIDWLWLGDSLQMQISTGVVELGRLLKRRRMPRLTTRAGLGVEVSHDALTQASVDALVAMLEHACTNDDARFGIVPNSQEGEAAIVRFAAESLEIEDAKAFQPRDTDFRWHRLHMTLEAAA